MSAAKNKIVYKNWPVKVELVKILTILELREGSSSSLPVRTRTKASLFSGTAAFPLDVLAPAAAAAAAAAALLFLVPDADILIAELTRFHNAVSCHDLPLSTLWLPLAAAVLTPKGLGYII